MPIDVFDFRRDIRNVLITPEIRSRFLRMEPHEVHGRHSHDLGHEIFLILEGRCQMEIEGETVVLEAGQMCVALRDQMHQASNPFDEPMTMYLSVTPHVEPTHTQWKDGTKQPWRYGNATARERAAQDPSPEKTAQLVNRQIEAARELAAVAAECAARHDSAGVALEQAASAGNAVAVKSAADSLWEQIYRLRRSLETLELTWNELAPRTMPT